ncbi:hypothetical protein [Actinopolymorpha rutila]|uniref:Uncharacterized protein n=1 Tax=Actinopolymorpha rutila TaxID=446787 RepID=A0A852ZLW1_9ACTN|nr:hypothetical protein [Actinopolymorpha rutila]NYH92858.1 hypothetical protein [Actinopolymorpha rutila]
MTEFLEPVRQFAVPAGNISDPHRSGKRHTNEARKLECPAPVSHAGLRMQRTRPKAAALRLGQRVTGRQVIPLVSSD